MCDMNCRRASTTFQIIQFRNRTRDCRPNDYFEKVVRDGYQTRKAQVWDREMADGSLTRPMEDYQKRLWHEMEVIKRMGYAGYFLIVWDFVRYAKENGIPVGPGRGSSAGSLVAYCLGITDVDPLQLQPLLRAVSQS